MVEVFREKGVWWMRGVWRKRKRRDLVRGSWGI